MPGFCWPRRARRAVSDREPPFARVTSATETPTRIGSWSVTESFKREQRVGRNWMLSRRELLRRGAAIAGPALMLGRVPGAEAAASRPTVAGMNVIIFITDQQRHQQHFPPGWSKRNLPGFSRLQAHGLTFENAFCSASMCSPSRASLLTGYFPAQHGVKYTLEDNMPDDEYPQVELSTSFKNIADRDGGGRLQRRLQGQVAREQADRQRIHPAGPRALRLPAMEPTGRRRQSGRRAGGRRRVRQRRAVHERNRHSRQRRRGRVRATSAPPRPASSRSV